MFDGVRFVSSKQPIPIDLVNNIQFITFSRAEGLLTCTSLVGFKCDQRQHIQSIMFEQFERRCYRIVDSFWHGVDNTQHKRIDDKQFQKGSKSMRQTHRVSNAINIFGNGRRTMHIKAEHIQSMIAQHV